MSKKLLWGIDLGGTKIECVVLSPDTYEVLARHRVDTEREQGYQHILQQFSKLLATVSDDIGSKPQNIGIGVPGIFDHHRGVMSRGNTLCLNEQPFKDDLQKLSGANVIIENDANCFALAETHLGVISEVCPNAQVVFGVILGTGVGGGIVINGKPLAGHHGIGGEWGHIFLEDNANVCYCGNQGCVESFISGPALEKYYEKLSGKHLPLKEIASLESSDQHAKQTIDRLISMFGKAIIQIVNVLDPDVIVIGGGVGNINALYERVIPEMNKYIYADGFKGKLIKPKLGDSAGVFGAAMLSR